MRDANSELKAKQYTLEQILKSQLIKSHIGNVSMLPPIATQFQFEFINNLPVLGFVEWLCEVLI
jgi:hypothetical protein